jgi:hypothetical protein
MWISIAGLGLSMLVLFIGGIVFAVRQEGRINEHAMLFVERETLELVRWGEIKDRLQRIEYKIDRANGGSKGKDS